jgi:hypothetical protein
MEPPLKIKKPYPVDAAGMAWHTRLCSDLQFLCLANKNLSEHVAAIVLQNTVFGNRKNSAMAAL